MLRDDRFLDVEDLDDSPALNKPSKHDLRHFVEDNQHLS